MGMTTVQALWFRADDNSSGIEPDFLAFTPMDVPRNAVRRRRLSGRKSSFAVIRNRSDNAGMTPEQTTAPAPASPSRTMNAAAAVSTAMASPASAHASRRELSFVYSYEAWGQHVRRLQKVARRSTSTCCGRPRITRSASAPFGRCSGRCRCARRRSSARTSRGRTGSATSPRFRRAAGKADVPRVRATQIRLSSSPTELKSD